MAGAKGKSGGARRNAGRKSTSIPRSTYANDKTFENFEELSQDFPKCELELVFPKDLKTIPHAKEIWNEVIEIDKASDKHLLNARHAEALKTYCLQVAMRRLLLKEWDDNGQQMTITDSKGNIKINPILVELDRMNKQINIFAEALGLTILGEYKLAREARTSPTLFKDKDEESENKDESDNLFN